MASIPSALHADQDNFRSPQSTSRAVWVARTGSLATLCLLAGVVGVISFSYLRKEEETKVEQEFKRLASSILDRAKSNTDRVQLGAQTLATLVGNAHPDATEYPFVAVRGWEETARALMATVDTEYFSYSPIVEAEDLHDFGHFAHDYYHTTKGWDNSTIRHSIWNFNPHDFDEVSPFSESTTRSMPFFHFSAAPYRSDRLLFNAYSVPNIRNVMDSIMNSSERVDGMMTSMSTANGTTLQDDPAAAYLAPVYPGHDPMTVSSRVKSSLLLTNESAGWLCTNRYQVFRYSQQAFRQRDTRS